LTLSKKCNWMDCERDAEYIHRTEGNPLCATHALQKLTNYAREWVKLDDIK